MYSKKVSPKQGLEFLKLQIWEVYIYIYLYTYHIYILLKFTYIHKNISYPNKWAFKIPLYLTHKLYWVFFILSQNSGNIFNNTAVFNSAQDTLGITMGTIILWILYQTSFPVEDICFDLFYLLEFPHGVYLMK